MMQIWQKQIFIKEIMDLNKWKIIYLFQKSRSSESSKIIQSCLMKQLQGIIKIDLSIIFSVSLRCLGLLSNTRVLMYLMRQVLPGPVFLGADGRFFFLAWIAMWTTAQHRPIFWILPFYPYCIVYFRSESNITKVFLSPHYFLIEYELFTTWRTRKLIFRGTAAFDKLQNLLGSSSQASIHALDWILYEQVKKRQKVTFSKTVYLYIFFIYTILSCKK